MKSVLTRRLPPRSPAWSLAGLLLVAVAVACCHTIILPVDHHDADSCAVCESLGGADLSPVVAILGAGLAFACLRPQPEARIASRPSLHHRGRSPPFQLISIRSH